MIKLLKIEFTKIRKTLIWYILLGFVVLFFCLNYIFFIDFQDKFWRTVSVTQDINPWHFFVENQAQRIEFCIGINVLIFITWLHYEETSNHMWERNFLLPTPIYKIIIAKIILVSIIAFLLLVLLFVFTLGFLKPKLNAYYSFLFQDKHNEDTFVYLKWFLFYPPVILKIIVFQEWLTIKLKNSHFVSFFIGFLGITISFIKFSPYFMRFFFINRPIESVLSSFIYILLFAYFIHKELSNGDFQ